MIIGTLNRSKQVGSIRKLELKVVGSDDSWINVYMKETISVTSLTVPFNNLSLYTLKPLISKFKLKRK